MSGPELAHCWRRAVPTPAAGWRHAVLLETGPARTVLEELTRQGEGELVDVGAVPVDGAAVARCLAALERGRVTHLSAPSAVLRRLAEHPSAPSTDLDAVRAVVALDEPPGPPGGVGEVFAAAGVYVLAGRAATDPGPAADPAAVVAAASAAGEATLNGLTHAESARFVPLLERAVLASMLAALQRCGVLTGPEPGWTTEQVLAGAGVLPAHRRLVRRWLAALRQAGSVTVDGELLRGRRQLDPAEVDAAWRLARAAWVSRLGSATFVDYLRDNADRLDELLTGRVLAVSLLFPEGRSDRADAVYRDTTTARYLNAAIAAAVAAIRPRRVLEVGGGTAATTEAVLNRLGTDVEYVFSDVSRYFLDAATARFAGDPRLRTTVLDIDRPVAAGPAAGSVDVLLAAGVLNAARDVDDSLRRLARLLRPGGFLLVSEPTREHLEILASQAFMMAPPRDARARANTCFLTATQWERGFAGAGLTVVATLPAALGHPLAPLGQRLFVVRAP